MGWTVICEFIGNLPFRLWSPVKISRLLFSSAPFQFLIVAVLGAYILLQHYMALIANKQQFCADWNNENVFWSGLPLKQIHVIKHRNRPKRSFVNLTSRLSKHTHCLYFQSGWRRTTRRFRERRGQTYVRFSRFLFTEETHVGLSWIVPAQETYVGFRWILSHKETYVGQCWIIPYQETYARLCRKQSPQETYAGFRGQ